jgi:hypothetical protein
MRRVMKHSEEFPRMSLETSAAAPSLEIVQLELALQTCDTLEADFATSVRHALSIAGGELLFELRVDGIADAQRVAVVEIGEGEENERALVFMGGDGAMRVEAVSGQDDRLAGFAASYAGMMDRYGPAA